jgi:hypothetical protein
MGAPLGWTLAADIEATIPSALPVAFAAKMLKKFL